ncbi:MAG: sulfatase family protein [Candidatus Latescibacterota bacterium]|jgi:arylsulfatase A-like enzyme
MTQQPNLLVVLSDQLRRQALSCYGDPDARTPHTSSLANDGVRFVNACSTYPICVPFRFTMMTGEYAHTRLVPGIEYRMSPSERTLADEFNEAGYQTIYVGKWHLDGGHGRMGSAVQTNRVPVKRAYQGRWQKWYGFELRNGPFDTCYFEDENPTPIPIEGYQTDGLFDIGMNHLKDRRDADKPFCMVISVEPPHDPFEAPAEYQQAWEERDISLPPNFSAKDEAQREKFILERKRYNAMVENLDHNVGRLRTFLDTEGLTDNTVVVFLSDHGELGGAQGLGRKQWPYEESVGIPLIVCDPRVPERAGALVTAPTCTEDLFPTFLGLCGLAPKNALPGADLTPLVHGKEQKLEREGVQLEFVAELRQQVVFYDAVWRGFRSERFKYVVKGDKNASEPWLFFDLENDPYEMKNLVDDPAWDQEKARLHDLLRARIAETDDPFVLSPAWGCAGINVWQK